MLCAVWPQVRGDLGSSRRAAALFLDNLNGIHGPVSHPDWIAKWLDVGNAHAVIGDINIEKTNLNEASEAWLSALTAFEVARRLTAEGDPQSRKICSKIKAGVQRFKSLEQRVERVQIECCDQTKLEGYYLPGRRGLCTPAVICISREEETAATLLGRLLPVVSGRGISVLLLSHDEVSGKSSGQSEMSLSCCLDYLSARPEVDPNRIGVYGEGLSAILATDLAKSDRRIAAAVCDGGLWGCTRALASVAWITNTADAVGDEYHESVHRLRLVQQLRCPILVVAGGRGTVSVSEAMKLQADCTAARIDLELVLPRMTQTLAGEIENFVTSDDCIFEWLEQRLTQDAALSSFGEAAKMTVAISSRQLM